MQHRAMTASRLCVRLACIFSVSLHKSSLKYAGTPVSDLYKLTKNLAAQYTQVSCGAALEKMCISGKMKM